MNKEKLKAEILKIIEKVEKMSKEKDEKLFPIIRDLKELKEKNIEFKEVFLGLDTKDTDKILVRVLGISENSDFREYCKDRVADMIKKKVEMEK